MPNAGKPEFGWGDGKFGTAAARGEKKLDPYFRGSERARRRSFQIHYSTASGSAATAAPPVNGPFTTRRLNGYYSV
jgi:hypothetical protein